MRSAELVSLFSIRERRPIVMYLDFQKLHLEIIDDVTGNVRSQFLAICYRWLC